MSDLIDVNTLDILSLYKTKALSPLEYWQTVEARIDAFEPAINALYEYDPAAARAQAQASTQRWMKGETWGPLDGIPVSLKELIATKGQPVPLGTRATELTPALADAPAAARLREDGAILYAKTTCPDYGMLSSGLSSFHKLSRNPWDLSQNPGGSSAGAASAGAAGYGTLHIGTDIGGSVRLPAGWTGLFGFKPSQGRIPVDPFFTGRCAGPMTRTVADAAFSMATLSRPDWRDGTSLPPNTIDWMDLAIDVKGLKIGLMLDAGCGLPVEAEVRDAVLAAARLFEAAGAVIVPAEPVITRQMLDGLDDFWRARFWGDIAPMPESHRELILPYIYEWAKSGADVSGARAVFGFNQTMEMRKTCGQLFQKVDVVISPTNPIVSYPADWASPTNDPAKPFEHIAFTVPWNMSEQPAASINCGFSSSGMPIGLQIIGPRYEDLFVLKLSKAFEEWTGGIQHWPKPPIV